MREDASGPRLSTEHEMPRLSAYESVVGAEEVEQIRRLAAGLRGMRIQHLSSTYRGGGVAELLARLVPLMQDVGLHASWDVIRAEPGFFQVTKDFHNALHGAYVEILPEDYSTYLETTRNNLALVDREADFVVTHDPQTVGLVEARQPIGRQYWLWRCHIDLVEADPRVWGFLRSYVERHDASIFHLAESGKDLLIPQILLTPAIDPLDEKNRELPEEEIRQVVTGFGIDMDRPILLQVSRFDRLKDPLGVIAAYRMVRKWNDCQLVLAGGTATDDPEGEEVLAEVRQAAEGDPDIHVLALPPDSHRIINALQRAATVVVQKSIREGFGLVVTEAMWKGKPVVGSAVGGIRRQIFSGSSGYLAHTTAGTAFRIREILANEGLAERLGRTARAYVHANFLITRYLKSWLLAMHSVRSGARISPTRI
ncbi:MAG TPA: glycosyltransferase [Fredinandcohnia sp.]|nr:glycosyltransferase [Fredinandcohnia sp.]